MGLADGAIMALDAVHLVETLLKSGPAVKSNQLNGIYDGPDGGREAKKTRLQGKKAQSLPSSVLTL